MKNEWDNPFYVVWPPAYSLGRLSKTLWRLGGNPACPGPLEHLRPLPQAWGQVAPAGGPQRPSADLGGLAMVGMGRFTRDSVCSVRSQCDLSRPNKARLQTRVTRRWVCRPCLNDVTRRDPNETPLQYRAKISLEIYTLAELQRQSMLTNNAVDFLWMEPTAWDCAILPGLSYKPDNIWCFDHYGNPFIY